MATPQTKPYHRRGGQARMARLAAAIAAGDVYVNNVRATSLSHYQSLIADFRKPENMARNGRKGYRATVAKYGPAVFAEATRHKELTHPSAPMRRFLEILQAMTWQEGQDYEREYILPLNEGGSAYYMLDLMCLPLTVRKGIELFGGIHSAEERIPRLRGYDDEKLRRLQALGLDIFIVYEADLAAPQTLAEHLIQWRYATAKEHRVC